MADAADPSVAAAVEQAARWLRCAGCIVEAVELDAGRPTGARLVCWRFREDLGLRARETIEPAAAFSRMCSRPAY